jgi:hypothetical protein
LKALLRKKETPPELSEFPAEDVAAARGDSSSQVTDAWSLWNQSGSIRLSRYAFLTLQFACRSLSRATDTVQLRAAVGGGSLSSHSRSRQALPLSQVAKLDAMYSAAAAAANLQPSSAEDANGVLNRRITQNFEAGEEVAAPLPGVVKRGSTFLKADIKVRLVATFGRPQLTGLCHEI